MWACVMGLKKHLSKNDKTNGLLYKKHKPGLKIKENSIANWCDDLESFKNWQLYVPDYYVKKISE